MDRLGRLYLVVVVVVVVVVAGLPLHKVYKRVVRWASVIGLTTLRSSIVGQCCSRVQDRRVQRLREREGDIVVSSWCWSTTPVVGAAPFYLCSLQLMCNFVIGAAVVGICFDTVRNGSVVLILLDSLAGSGLGLN